MSVVHCEGVIELKTETSTPSRAHESGYQRQILEENPKAMEFDFHGGEEFFRPSASDLRKLAVRYSNSEIARACGVTEVSVRKWRDPLELTCQRPTQPGGQAISA